MSDRLTWRPRRQTPLVPTSAVIAADLTGQGHYYLVGGLYVWRDGQWIEETTGQPLETDSEYYWLPEGELTGTIAR